MFADTLMGGVRIPAVVKVVNVVKMVNVEKVVMCVIYMYSIWWSINADTSIVSYVMHILYTPAANGTQLHSSVVSHRILLCQTA